VPRRAVTLLVGVVLTLPPRPARADDGPSVFAGLGLTPPWGHTSVTAAGRTNSEGQNFAGWLELGGYTELLHPRFAVLGIARIATWQSDWAASRGESRGVLDLAVGPELRIKSERVPRVVLHVAAPVGYAKAWIGPGQGRAVRESYGGGHGYTFGLRPVAELWGPTIATHQGGAYASVSYVSHILFFERRTELVSDPSVRATERYRFVIHDVLFTVGGVLSL
jgi:hypothetical protein